MKRLLNRLNSTNYFGLRYRLFIELLRITVFTPIRWRLPLARRIGEKFSPYRNHPTLFAAMGQALCLSDAQKSTQKQQWLQNHGIAIATLFHYPSLKNHGWLNSIIDVQNGATVEKIRTQGGLVLTTHCHYQNLIAAYLGKASGAMYPLATSPESASLYRWIGRYIRKLNHDSERWFGEGHYLFTEKKKESIQGMRSALETGKVALALCDIHQASSSSTPAHGILLGRYFTPPTGSIKSALKYDVPIYAAHLIALQERLVLSVEEIRAPRSVEETLLAYCMFLEAQFRAHPSSWQGWEWWNGLPDHRMT